MVVLTKSQGGGEKEWEISYNTCFEESGLGVGVILRENYSNTGVILEIESSVQERQKFDFIK